MLDEETATTMDRILNKLRDASRAGMVRSTIPIFAAHDGGIPIAHGSGVLLAIDTYHFLLSCAHVLKVTTEGAALATCGESGAPLVSFAPTLYRWTEDAHLDIGFTLLGSAALDALPKEKGFLGLADLALEQRQRSGIYGVVGYPVAKADRDVLHRHIDSTPISFVGYPPAEHVQDFIEGTTLEIEFNNQVIGDQTGELARVPALNGISGCGFWRLAPMDGSCAPDFSGALLKLVGIEHRVIGWGTGAIIKGTSITKVLEMIHVEYPELRKTIDVHISRS